MKRIKTLTDDFNYIERKVNSAILEIESKGLSVFDIKLSTERIGYATEAYVIIIYGDKNDV